jgi:hypothetical protein
MFYVYELRDPRNGVAFYVGKGQGDRAHAHQREVVRGTARSNPAKIAKIREILETGHQVEVSILAEYRDESDALDHEYHSIVSRPDLTNMRVDLGLPQKLSPLARAERHCILTSRLLNNLIDIQHRRRKKQRQKFIYPDAAVHDLRGTVSERMVAQEWLEKVRTDGPEDLGPSSRQGRRFRSRLLPKETKHRNHLLSSRIDAARILVEEADRARVAARRQAQQQRASCVVD